MSDSGSFEHLVEDQEDLVLDDENPPPAGGGPAASVEDFRPDDPDTEAIVDEE